MKNFSELPDLVIVKILKQVLEETSNTGNVKNNLPYLAICQIWRSNALPLVYRSLVIKCEGNTDDGENIYYNIMTNIDLIAKNNYMYFVKRLHLEYNCVENFIDAHISIINTIKAGKDNIIANDQVKDTAEMAEAVNNFKEAYPNIVEMLFYSSIGSAAITQFTSMLVHAYMDKLQLLDCMTNSPIDLPCFPLSIRSLKYQFQPLVFTPTPYFPTAQLKKLELHGIPADLSWKNVCPNAVWPYLNNVELHYLDPKEQNDRIELARTQNIKMDIEQSNYEMGELPTLENIFMDCGYNHYVGLCMSSNSISLKNVTFTGYVKNMEALSKISVEPAQSVIISVIDDMENVNDIDVFYQVTNMLFGSEAPSRYNSYIYLDILGFEIDFKKANWVNLLHLQTNSMSSTSLNNAIITLPQLQEIDITALSLAEGRIDRESISRSKLKSLRICHIFDMDKADSERAYIFNMVKNLKYLQKVYIQSEFYESVLPLITKTKDKHAHFHILDMIKI